MACSIHPVGLALPAEMVVLRLIQRVGLLVPEAENVLERTRPAAEEALVILVHPAGNISAYIHAPIRDKALHTLRKSRPEHVSHGPDDYTVAL